MEKEDLEIDAKNLRDDHQAERVLNSAKGKPSAPKTEKDGWGYDRHLFALARHLKRPVVILRPEGVEVFKPDLTREPQPADELDPKVWGSRPIVLTKDGNHYNAVVESK